MKVIPFKVKEDSIIPGLLRDFHLMLETYKKIPYAGTWRTIMYQKPFLLSTQSEWDLSNFVSMSVALATLRCRNKQLKKIMETSQTHGIDWDIICKDEGTWKIWKYERQECIRYHFWRNETFLFHVWSWHFGKESIYW